MQEPSFIQYLLLKTIEIYILVIIVRAIMSWFNLSYQSSFYRLLLQLTEPFLSRIRKFLPRTSGIDFSPLIAIILLNLLSRIVAGF
jgi:YggT family protein